MKDINFEAWALKELDRAESGPIQPNAVLELARALRHAYREGREEMMAELGLGMCGASVDQHECPFTLKPILLADMRAGRCAQCFVELRRALLNSVPAYDFCNVKGCKHYDQPIELDKINSFTGLCPECFESANAVPIVESLYPEPRKLP